AFVEGDKAMLEPQEIHNRQVLARLRHHSVIGRYDEKHEIDARGSGEHIVHETLVPGDVNETDDFAARSRPIGESQIDRDAAGLFLLQAAGIDAGQPHYKGRLTMIDMSGSADDHDLASTPRGK